MGKTTHGLSKTPEHRTWLSVLRRCDSPSFSTYPYYGGKGIKVHEAWRGPGGFEQFLAHVGKKPSPEYTIDRIDSNGHYEPGNVRWATREQQAQNKSNTHYITANNETLCLAEWSRRVGISSASILKRIERGWSLDDAVSLGKAETPRLEKRSRTLPAKSQTGYKGVRKKGDKFQARIQVNGKQLLLGLFNTAEEAAQAYDAAVTQYLGFGYYTNFPQRKKYLNDNSDKSAVSTTSACTCIHCPIHPNRVPSSGSYK